VTALGTGPLVVVATAVAATGKAVGKARTGAGQHQLPHGPCPMPHAAAAWASTSEQTSRMLCIFFRQALAFVLPATLGHFHYLAFFCQLLFAFSVFGYSILAMTARATLNAPLQLFVLCGLGLRNENENGDGDEEQQEQGLSAGQMANCPSPRIPLILMVMAPPHNASPSLCWSPVLRPSEGSSLS